MMLTGSEGDDTLVGATADDTIIGLGGDDSLSGGNGRDVIDGGVGNDTLDGGLGDDTLYGGAGDDVISDSYGRNTIDGGDGQDIIRAGGGAVSGGGGDDRIISYGAETVDGGDGNDLISIDRGFTILRGGAGQDTFALAAHYSASIMDFSPGDAGDRLDLGNLLTELGDYSGGNPFLTGHFRLWQGATDTYLLVSLSHDNEVVAAVTLRNVTIDQLTASNFGGYAPDGSLVPGQAFTGSHFSGTLGDDTISGPDGDDSLSGGDGRDVIESGGGNDTLEGGLGDDTLYGGAGDDVIRDSYGRNTIDGGDGQDRIWATGGAVSGGDGDDQIVSYGAETVDGGAGNDLITVSLGSGLLTGGAGQDTFALAAHLAALIMDFTAGDAGDRLDMANVLNGLTSYHGGNPFNTGHFQLEAFPGGTQLVVSYDLDGHYGIALTLKNVTPDQLTASNFGGYAPDGSVVAGQVFAGSDFWGTIGNDTITGTDGNDSLSGGDGQDAIDGGAGNDTLDGGVGDDVVHGGAGDDVIDDSHGVDTIDGGDGDDRIVGYYGQTINGGAGNDLISVGERVATVSGGAGQDTFVLAVDQYLSIKDFSAGDSGDRLDLQGMIGGLADYTGGNPFLTGHFRLRAGSNYTLLEVSYSHDMHPDGDFQTVVILSGVAMTQLTASNFGGYEPITGTTHKDLMNGTVGDDVLNAIGGDDTLNGLDGNDRLDGGSGLDTMTGGKGNDTYTVDNYGDTVVELAAQGTDVVNAGINYTLGANVERLVLIGTANIAGTGNELANQITGNTGNNRLDGGAGADTLIGGLGNDTYYIDNAGDKAAEAQNEGVDQVNASINFTLGSNVENLLLTGSALDGTGNGLNNVIWGNDGANRLDGGAGVDKLLGGLGDDTYVIDNASDKAEDVAGGGVDIVLASNSHILSQYVENLTLTGSLNITATGNDLDNILIGNSGNNRLTGGLGADAMTGGAGHDTYYVDNVGDTVTEGLNAGVDLVQAYVSFTLSDNVENLYLNGSGNLNGTGNAINNLITGTAGNNVLDGAGGVDKLFGGLGDDTYYLDNASDSAKDEINGGTDLVYSSASWVMTAYIENMTLTGSANITGTGNALANILIGNAGNNKLDGWTGNDSLTGGLGNDTFVFGASSGVDTITDFTTSDYINTKAYSAGTAFGDGITVTQVGGDVLINLGGGNTVTVLSALRADVVSHMLW